MYVLRRDVFENLLRGRKSSVSLQDLFVRVRSPNTGEEKEQEEDEDDEDEVEDDEEEDEE